MKKNLLAFTSFAILLAVASGCKHTQPKPLKLSLKDNTPSLAAQSAHLIFVPENKRIPPHVLYEKVQRYRSPDAKSATAFHMEMPLNPLMRNLTITANLEKNGKVVREFAAKKNAQALLSDKKTTWSPTRSKLSLSIPYVAPDEDIVVTTSYEWMDIRWLTPIFLQDGGITAKSQLTVEVPYGITMHFRSTRDGQAFDFVPTNFSHENSLWASDDNQSGLGMRYLWEAEPTSLSKSFRLSDRLQVYLSFEAPGYSENQMKFDNWDSVASYLYNRIDRYDMPSNEIRDFCRHQTKEYALEFEKLDHVLNFLRTKIEKRKVTGSYHEQAVQPATRTFARRYGSPIDIAILGKAMLTSLGFQVDLVASADRDINPVVTDFYSPALFSSIILAVSTQNGVVYFDPSDEGDILDQLRPNLQGQRALLVKPQQSKYFSIPYDSPYKNAQTHTYQLWLDNEGILEGEYSIDLSGHERDLAKGIDTQSIEPLSLESTELLKSAVPFAFDNVDLTREGPFGLDLRLFGQIKPQMLTKNSAGGFDLKLDRVIQPALHSIRNAREKGYSSTTKISLFMGLPENFEVKNLPDNVHVQLDGVDARFSVLHTNGTLVVEGTALVQLPISRDLAQFIAIELGSAILFGEQVMAIHDSSIVTGETNDEQKPDAPENS